jgi:hypothetical protein
MTSPYRQYPPPPRRTSNTGLIVGVLAACFGGMFLVVCLGYAVFGRTADPAPPAAAPPPVTTPAADQAEPYTGLVPTPDAETQAAYLAALAAIDPAIIGDKDPRTLVNRGRDQCGSVAEWPDDEERLIELTNRRFTSPDHPQGFGPEKAARILDAVRTYICP